MNETAFHTFRVEGKNCSDGQTRRLTHHVSTPGAALTTAQTSLHIYTPPAINILRMEKQCHGLQQMRNEKQFTLSARSQERMDVGQCHGCSRHRQQTLPASECNPATLISKFWGSNTIELVLITRDSEPRQLDSHVVRNGITCLCTSMPACLPIYVSISTYPCIYIHTPMYLYMTDSVALVRERTIPTERPPLCWRI
jgi:hypothetical protein